MSGGRFGTGRGAAPSIPAPPPAPAGRGGFGGGRGAFGGRGSGEDSYATLPLALLLSRLLHTQGSVTLCFISPYWSANSFSQRHLLP